MLTEFLIKQSQKPSGLIGRVITKIWSFYFKKLSLWAIKQTTISDNYRILEIGYGGGSTIKNLLALNKNLEIHGIDISKESYRTAQRVHSDSIRKGSVQLKIGNVENMPYQNNYFDRIFAIQTHIFWKDIKKRLEQFCSKFKILFYLYTINKIQLRFCFSSIFEKPILVSN